jgi:MSHA pilin protein MshA
MRKLQHGFTSIEVAVVVTLLGIVVAIAIPRFTELEDQGRISAVTALDASLHSAAALAHAEYLALGNSPSTVMVQGSPVTLANGYPDVKGIQLAVQDVTGFAATTTATSVTYTKTGATKPESCSVVYTMSPGQGVPPTFAVPQTSGC